jgi:hypothetical protein
MLYYRYGTPALSSAHSPYHTERLTKQAQLCDIVSNQESTGFKGTNRSLEGWSWGLYLLKTLRYLT